MALHYDVIIIGAGAGGGTLAYALAPTGKSILLIERGDYLPREKENWDPDAIFIQRRYQAEEEWLDANLQPFNPETYYVVGGQHQALWCGSATDAGRRFQRNAPRRRLFSWVAVDLRRF